MFFNPDLISSIFNSLKEALVVVDENNKIVYVNKTCEEFTGYKLDEVVGKNPKVFTCDESNFLIYDKIIEELKKNDSYVGDLTNRHKKGDIYSTVVKITKYHDKQQNKKYYFAVFTNPFVSLKNQDELSYLAYHDSLTGLPNRLKLKAQLEYVLNNSKRNNLKFALLFLDLDNFKKVNDHFGHLYGDNILVELASKFKSSIRSNDMVARVGGDEFIIVLSDISDYLFIEKICKKIIKMVSKVNKTNKNDIKLGISIGIALYPENGNNAEELIHNADSAMYGVKYGSKNSFELFSKDMNKKLLEHTLLKKDLENAIKNDEFVLHFQPEIDTVTKKVFSIEILSRWNHGKNGLLLPGSFIPDLQISELIFPFEELILKKACNQLKKWQENSFYDGTISVNLSSKYLEKQDLFETVKNILDDLELDGKYLVFEFDEEAISNICEKTLTNLEKLSNMGIMISINNFGKEVISYQCLKKCFISRLKIDKSYIDSLMEKNSDEDIIKSIISLGENMNISVIAEGIEVLSQDTFVKNNSCSKVQGYFYARPMGIAKFETWYKQFSS